MGKLLGPGLRHSHPVFASDDETPIYEEIHVGFNRQNELTIVIDHINYHEPWNNCSTAAVVVKEDAEAMAKRHGIRYGALPGLVSRSMDEWDEIVLPSCSNVRDCFKEIMDRLLEEDCRYRMERTYGRGGSVCC